MISDISVDLLLCNTFQFVSPFFLSSILCDIIYVDKKYFDEKKTKNLISIIDISFLISLRKH